MLLHFEFARSKIYIPTYTNKQKHTRRKKVKKGTKKKRNINTHKFIIFNKKNYLAIFKCFLGNIILFNKTPDKKRQAFMSKSEAKPKIEYHT
jgi:hypothetical protein